MIAIRDITKRFGSTTVLDHVSLEIGRGVTALVGPNASGKTTLLKIVMGLVFPTEGTVSVDGVELKDGSVEKRRISYMPQRGSFPENLTVEELFRFISDIRGRAMPAELKERLIEDFELRPFLTRPVRKLSIGTQHKVNALLALVFDTPILLMDEPTAGLDPVAVRRFKDILLEERERGKTILFTSHIVDEIDELADNVVFLIEGRIIFTGPPSELKELTGASTIERAIAAVLTRHNNREVRDAVETVLV